AAPAAILKSLLVPPLSPVAGAVAVSPPLPPSSRLSVAKEAPPGTAATVVVPASVPPAGLVPPSATVTLPERLGTVFPAASCAATCTAGVSVAPAVGCAHG